MVQHQDVTRFIGSRSLPSRLPYRYLLNALVEQALLAKESKAHTEHSISIPKFLEDLEGT
jgi:hypothetical protein